MNHILIKQTVKLKKKNEEKYTTDKNYCNVKEHCHLTCNYRGAAHSIWNIVYLKKFLWFFPMGLTTITI